METFKTPSINRYKLYQEAKRVVEVRIAYIIHIIIYLAVNALLFLVNLQTVGEAGYWFLWPAMVWGGGILVQGCFIFLYSRKNIRHRLQEGIRGKKTVQMLMGLGLHWSLFIILNILLFVINAITRESAPELGYWSIWVFFGWGIGICFHSVWVYLNKDHKLKRWKRRKALKILEEWGGLS